MKKSAPLSLCLIASTLLWSAAVAAQDERPNILLVLFDDVGFSGFGAYGSDARTPRIDELAERGVRLSRYYTAPFCGPTRAMLMTGMDSHQVGMGTLVETVTPAMQSFPGYSMHWDADQETIATMLSRAGYQTYVTGKWGIGEIGANLPSRFGFDRSYVMDATGGGNYDAKPYLPGSREVKWFENGEPVTLPEDHYSSRTIVDQMIEYIDAGNREQPFFSYLSFQTAHIPIQAPVEYVDRYNGIFDAGWDVMREARLRRTIDLGLVPDTTTLASPPANHRAWLDLTPEERSVSAREMQVNAGMMEAADYHLGRLLDHLDAIGALQNTVVMVLSDNGAESAKTSLDGPANLALDAIKLIEGFDTSYENLGLRRSLTAVGREWASVLAAPFDLYKFYASEGGLRVPLIAAGPGIATSKVAHAPVHVADLVPTILEATGVAYDPDQFYGRSALPMLSANSDTTYKDDESFSFEVSGNAAVYRGQWKITRNTPPQGDGTWRLYDLSMDPGETTDLSAQNSELFEEMLAEYRSYANRVGVYEVGPEEYAITALSKNLLLKVFYKYWLHLLGLMIAVGAALFFIGKFGLALLLPR
ncbi:arylsulfatase, partial [Congregibacter sp.]|uniref:arylsulfatase n=1 Tax=Congregibacter sp. TaxID=2744308 RepID=UPI003F6A96D1